MTFSRHNITEETISEVHVSPRGAEISVRRGVITNHHSIAQSLSNTSGKNYRYRLMCVEVVVSYIGVVFLRRSVYIRQVAMSQQMASFLAGFVVKSASFVV